MAWADVQRRLEANAPALRTLHEMAQAHPRVRLLIHEHEPAEAFALLRTDDVDLALTYDYDLAPADFDLTLESTPLWTTRWGLGVHADEVAVDGRQQPDEARLVDRGTQRHVQPHHQHADEQDQQVEEAVDVREEVGEVLADRRDERRRHVRVDGRSASGRPCVRTSRGSRETISLPESARAGTAYACLRRRRRCHAGVPAPLLPRYLAAGAKGTLRSASRRSSALEIATRSGRAYPRA